MRLKVLKELYGMPLGEKVAGQVRGALRLHKHGPILVWGYGAPYAVENVTMVYEDVVGEKRLPYGDGAFAQVVLVHVLEVAPDPAAVLQEAFRVLQGQGVVAVVVPQKVQAGTPFYVGRTYTTHALRTLLENDFNGVTVIGCGALGFVPQMSDVLVGTGVKQVYGGRKITLKDWGFPWFRLPRAVGTCCVRCFHLYRRHGKI